MRTKGEKIENKYGRIELNGVGIAGLNIDKTKENEEKLAQFTVELFVEQMNFNLNDTEI